jgi:ribonuclease T2
MGLRAAILAFGLASGLAATAATTAQERAGDFDYWLLALSWSPSWCAAEGDARDAPQCDPARDAGFVVHGLWPQYEEGWPEFCRTAARDPSRRETAAEADLFGDAGAAWYQWRKHGRCSGEDPAAYFGTVRLARGLVTLPEPPAPRITPAALEAAFRAANPDVPGDAVAVTCRDGLLMELRLCLTRDLAPRSCGEDVLARSCRADRTATMPPVR